MSTSPTACSFASHFCHEMAQNADLPIIYKNFSGVTPPTEPPPCDRTRGCSVNRLPLFWLTQLSDSSRAPVDRFVRRLVSLQLRSASDSVATVDSFSKRSAVQTVGLHRQRQKNDVCRIRSRRCSRRFFSTRHDTCFTTLIETYCLTDSSLTTASVHVIDRQILSQHILRFARTYTPPPVFFR